MLAQPALVTTTRRMTWPEICASYPNGWVVLGDIDSDPITLVLHSAVVLSYGKTRREATDAAGELGPELIAYRYTGRPKSPWHP